MSVRIEARHMFSLVPYQGREVVTSHGFAKICDSAAILVFILSPCHADAVVRGHRSGLLTTADYNNLCQCETLDDIKLNLVSVDFIIKSSFRMCISWNARSALQTLRLIEQGQEAG